MQRINTATKAVDKFGPNKHGFKDGNRAGGIAATVVDAAWADSVQEEVSNVIEGFGGTLDPANNAQMFQRIQSAIAAGVVVPTDGIVRYTTTGNIVLSGLGTQAGGDWPGALNDNDLILVQSDTTGGEDGWYNAHAGAWTRATFADTSAEIKSGFLTQVTEGSTLADTIWVLTTDGPITLGTTALVFKPAFYNFYTAIAGGTADAITAVFSPAITALNNQTIFVKAAYANATTTPTVNPGSGVITIVKGNNLPLAVGDIPGAGFWAEMKLDLALGKAVLLNPANGVIPPYVKTLNFQDSRASGTAGQSLTGGAWNTRTLQTTVLNEISGASLASNQITLPAGTYDIEGRAAMHENSLGTVLHRARIRNITAGATLLSGVNEYCAIPGAGTTVGNTAKVSGRIVLALTSVIELQHYVSVAAANLAVSTGENEIYSDVIIKKMA